MTKQEQYNDVMKKLNAADEYFQQRYKTDTQDRQVKAVERFNDLIKQAEKLFHELRPSHMTYELQYGFEDGTMTLQLDIEQEVAALLERLDIIRADGWTVEKMEYLKESKKLLVGLKRKAG